jgi:hypothetical protein
MIRRLRHTPLKLRLRSQWWNAHATRKGIPINIRNSVRNLPTSWCEKTTGCSGQTGIRIRAQRRMAQFQAIPRPSLGQDESEVCLEILSAQCSEILSAQSGLSKPAHGMKQPALLPVCNAKREKHAMETTSSTAHVLE